MPAKKKIAAAAAPKEAPVKAVTKKSPVKKTPEVAKVEPVVKAPAKAVVKAPAKAPAKAVSVPVAKAPMAAAVAAAPKVDQKPKAVLSPEERYQRVQTEAYFIAEKNGFRGDSHAYWVAAEAKVASELA